MIAALAVARRLADGAPPLTPDGDEARRWAERELADPGYAAAQPTAIDRVAQAVGRFVDNLLHPQLDGATGSWLAVAAAIVVIGLVVAALAIWGRPRAQPRGAARGAELFGESEVRSAAELRRDADAHASRNEWDEAIVLRFRAVARTASERDLVDTPPGTTVHGFARAVAAALPAEAASVETAARVFDDVRYLRRPGTAAGYTEVAAVDERMARARRAPADALA